jgi:hypothetical protein
MQSLWGNSMEELVVYCFKFLFSALVLHTLVNKGVSDAFNKFFAAKNVAAIHLLSVRSQLSLKDTKEK